MWLLSHFAAGHAETEEWEVTHTGPHSCVPMEKLHPSIENGFPALQTSMDQEDLV